MREFKLKTIRIYDDTEEKLAERGVELKMTGYTLGSKYDYEYFIEIKDPPPLPPK